MGHALRQLVRSAFGCVLPCRGGVRSTLIPLLVLGTATAAAQVTSGAAMGVGFATGARPPAATTDNASSDHTGFAGTLFGQARIHQRFGIRVDASLNLIPVPAVQGAGVASGPSGDRVIIDWGAEAVSVWLLSLSGMVLLTPAASQVQLFLFAGGGWTHSGGDFGPNSDPLGMQTAFLPSTDVGYVAGLQLLLPSGSDKYFVEVRAENLVVGVPNRSWYVPLTVGATF